jgi:1,4-alpha-glucan branching enzyme
MSIANPLTKNTVTKIEGMGSIPHEQGVAFRLWAPHAEQVSVIGTFNNWDTTTHLMNKDQDGFWYLNISDAKIGDQYKYELKSGDIVMQRIDPYAREVTNSVGNAVITDLAYDWENDQYQLPPKESLVIYEMHIGTFGRSVSDPDTVADFSDAIRRLDYLKSLGINCVELMPVAEFAGDVSWGYNPAHIFAVESYYGGPAALQRFIHEAHKRGIGVILDVVYNHFGPSDLALWQFDGWTENGKGGIYFYNDWRAETPWGETRPDYGRKEVRQYIFDNAMMWVQDFHVDGLRMDMTLYIRSVRATCEPGCELPDGWSLTQWINEEISSRYPHVITIAEDLQNNEWVTKSTGAGGAGFSCQWDAGFVHPAREALITMEDPHRSMQSLVSAIEHSYNGDAFQRVIYTESHDEVANGKARVPEEIQPEEGKDWYARKRSTVGAVLIFTSPGVPMIFQGQEFLQNGWFKDTDPLDWQRRREFKGVFKIYQDLINLRTNRHQQSQALTGRGIEFHLMDEGQNIIAYRRWHEDNPEDCLLVVLNLNAEAQPATFHLPAGNWTSLMNTDADIYGEDFLNTPSPDFVSNGEESVTLQVGPYAATIYQFQPTEATAAKPE